METQKGRIAMGKVRGAVQWVDDPQVGRVILFHPSTLFREEAVVWVNGSNPVKDALFGGMVCIGHQVDGLLVLDAKTGASMLKE